MPRRPVTDHSRRFDPLAAPPAGKLFLDVVGGREGPCLCLGDENGGHRIAGPKPWGGGSTERRFVVDIDEVKSVLAQYEEKARA